MGGDWEEVTTTWKNSTFRLKLIKYDNELVPRAYKKSMNIFKEKIIRLE